MVYRVISFEIGPLDQSKLIVKHFYIVDVKWVTFRFGTNLLYMLHVTACVMLVDSASLGYHVLTPRDLTIN